MSQQGHIVVFDTLFEKFVSSTSYHNGTSYLPSVEIVTQIGDDGESRCQWQLYGWIKKHLGTMFQWGFLATLCRRQGECLSLLCGWGKRHSLKVMLLKGDGTVKGWGLRRHHQVTERVPLKDTVVIWPHSHFLFGFLLLMKWMILYHVHFCHNLQLTTQGQTLTKLRTKN